MKVSQKILDIINFPAKRMLIASSLGVAEPTIYYHLRGNKDNGRMTKYDALQAISEVTGVPIAEILEKGTMTNAAAN
jgi:hypothetical protein